MRLFHLFNELAPWHRFIVVLIVWVVLVLFLLCVFRVNDDAPEDDEGEPSESKDKTDTH